MKKITTNKEPRNRVTLYGTKFLSMRIDRKMAMIRSRVFGVKIQLNWK